MNNPTYDFNDQVALVTGAGSGMGLVTAQAFAEAGAAVVLADIDEAALGAATAWTWPSTTPGSRSRPAMPPTRRPRTSTASGASFVIGVALPVDGGFTAH
jgi:threonine dehydrogenase-like Zn-dependent dehydrogenase